jgi:hypothetical protein
MKETIIKSFIGTMEYRVFIDTHTDESLNKIFGENHWFVMKDGRQTDDYIELGMFLDTTYDKMINFRFIEERDISIYNGPTKYYLVETL